MSVTIPDFTQGRSFDDPWESYRWLRANDPVHWHEEPNGRGFWAVTRFEDVWTVDRDHQSFSSEPTIMIA